MGRCVVAVDNDSATLDLIEEVLQDEGYDVQRSSTPALSIDQVERVQPDFMLLELRPVNPNDMLVFLAKLRACVATQSVPVIVHSTDAHLLQKLALPLHHLGCATLEKPFDLDQFLITINQAANPDVFQWYLKDPLWSNTCEPA